ncbi:MAG: PAS domain S-box protein [Bacteroidota bacterium]
MTNHSEELDKLRSIFNIIPFGIIITGQDKKIQMVNSTGLTIMGFSSEADLLFTPISNIILEAEGKNDLVSENEFIPGRMECKLVQRNGLKIPILKYTGSVLLKNETVIIETFMDLSERKKRMELISETKRQFSNLLDNLPGMVYRCTNDRNWTMKFVSDGCVDLTGYLPDELIDNNKISFANIIVEADRERIWNEVQQGLNLTKPYAIEYRIRCADNRIKWVWENGKGIFDEAGGLLSIEGFISDITDQKNTELIQTVLFEISKTSYTSSSIDEVFKSIHNNLSHIIDVENFYIAIYDKVNDTISLPYQIDSNDSFLAFPAGKTLTGYVIRTRTPLLATKQIMEELTRTGQIQIIGSPAKVWMGVPLIVDNDVIGVIAVQSYTDPERYTFREFELLQFVADQIAIVVSKKEGENRFQKEKALLDQLFEGSPEAIITIDHESKVIKVNSEFTRLFGYQQEEILNKNIDDLISTPEIKDDCIQITNNALRGIITENETLRKHKDGHLIDVSIIVTPIVINGQNVGAYGIYRDITDRRNIEKNLIAAKEKAEESDKLKSAFLSNMSHEIRTPMNAILGFSTLLSDPGVTVEERGEFIHIIKERGIDLLRIIDDIIDVAKIESGQIKVEIEDCLINLLLSNLVVTLNEVKRKTNKINVMLNCLPGNPDKEFSIRTDGNRLRQIMTNLIENALKFTDEGFVEFGYTLKKTGTDSFIEFFVRDTGIGIPEEMHDVIFERFRQVDDTNTRKYGGTGLGLTISKNLIRLMGGEIRLSSESHQGTTFYVLFPLLLSKSKLSDSTKSTPSLQSAQIWSDKVILIVEDEDSNFILLDRILKRTGAKLVWAKTGIEAIEFCNTQHFDLVLMDIRMPGMDGYEATQAIKKDHPSLPIIAQTAYALKGERENSLAAGCDNYISKPIDTRELTSMLEKYLNK